MAWDLSCRDWERRIREGRSLVPKLPLWRAEAKRAVAIYDKLRLPDVPGTPALEQAGAEWFRDIMRALFGSLDPATGQRMIREVFCLVPKKNAKTTNGAAMMVAALLANRRPRAEFLLIGPTKMISDLAFSQAVGMIDNDPDGFLQKRMHVQEHIKTITDRRTKAQLKIKTFDTSVLTGVKPVGVLVDELHEIAASNDADRVIGQIRGGLIPNPEAFLMFITTQSERPPAGVFRAELNKARDIRDGKLQNIAMLPVLYEFPPEVMTDPEPGDNPLWYDPTLWWMVTPNRGKSITVERLEEDFAAARTSGQEEIIRWASQHLNIEVGLALRSDRWVGTDYWKRAAKTRMSLGELLNRCEVAVVGIDGGGLDDLLGLYVIGRERGTRRQLGWGCAWAHTSVLERRKDIAARLRDFEAQGDLIIVAQLGDDVTDLVDLIERISDRGVLAQANAIGVDPVGIGQILDELDARGLGNIPGEPQVVVSISQGWKLSGAIKTAERDLADGTLAPSDQELMAWCASNARVEPRGSAVTINKATSGSAKIDPLMAMFDAIALMTMNPEARESKYERSGLTVL